MEKESQQGWFAPYGFDEEPEAGGVAPVGDEPTGVENVRHDVVAGRGAPDNPDGVREVVRRGAVSFSPDGKAGDDGVMGYDRQIAALMEAASRYAPESEEERKKRERRERSKKIIAAVSDGISALSNLYFTTQYAPNMYDGKGSQLASVGDRAERLKAEREKNHDKYLNFALKIGDLQTDRAKTLREMEAQQEQLRLAKAKAQREADNFQFQQSLWPDKRREQAGKANKAEQEAITAQAEAEAAPELHRAKVATEIARKGSLDASAANSRASAAAHGRSNASEFSAWDEYGNEKRFRTKEAAEAFAKQHGTWQEEDETETTTGGNLRKDQTKTKKGGHPARPSQGTMPGVSDDRTMPGTE